MKKYLFSAVIACVAGALGAYAYIVNMPTQAVHTDGGTINVPAIKVANFEAPADFVTAAEASVNAVVHVKVSQKRQGMEQEMDLFQFFFGPRFFQQPDPEPIMGSGSGVIISTDGYIVTNNHVVEDADKIEVVLNDRRSFDAKLIGTDPTTDIALIKIEADDLSILTFGDSDALRVGEWVLAVGNPFNLTSTVTAGIVSAKSRRMGIINNAQNIGIEAFIQTDAAVNPGNSGGALVNTSGELVGINTAIASTTGSYTGYSFAVPSNIVQKVVEDLREYGEVQRALLGVSIADVTPDVQKKLKLEKPDGVVVMQVSDGGAAKEAGIQVDDVILSVDGETVNSVPELQEKIGRKRPGDAVSIDLIRKGEEKTFNVTLRNIRGTTGVVHLASEDKLLGATFAELTEQEKDKLGIYYGIKIKKLSDGKLKEAGVKENFIITKANRAPIKSVADFESAVSTASEGLFLSGIYTNGKVAYYAINLED